MEVIYEQAGLVRQYANFGIPQTLLCCTDEISFEEDIMPILKMLPVAAE